MWLTAAVTDTVSVPITHPGTRVVGSVAVLLQVQNCSLLLGIVWDKISDIKIGQWGRPWLVWYVPCKRRCVPRFTKLKHRHRHHNDRRWRCEKTHSVGTQWQSVGEPHDAIFTVSDELSLESPIKSWQLNVLLQSLASIPQIYQSIFQINRPERKTVLFTRNHDMCFAEKSARMRPGCSRWSAAWSKHWRQCVWLTCPTRDTLASRCSKRAARKLPRCGTGDRAKNTYCELSSFGPALFEIWWPDIYLGGPYGPVTDKMYWPELVRRSEKCAGPAGQCLCPVFCPGLKKGTVLLEGKGHFRARNYILRALLHAELHFEGTFVRGIVIRRKKMIILLVQYSNHIFG